MLVSDKPLQQQPLSLLGEFRRIVRKGFAGSGNNVKLIGETIATVLLYGITMIFVAAFVGQLIIAIVSGGGLAQYIAYQLVPLGGDFNARLAAYGFGVYLALTVFVIIVMTVKQIARMVYDNESTTDILNTDPDVRAEIAELRDEVQTLTRSMFVRSK